MSNTPKSIQKEIQGFITPHEEISLPPVMKKIAPNVRGFLSHTFDHIYCTGPSLDAAQMHNMSAMPVCTHRSHVDYFLFGAFLYQLGFRKIRYAAGDNLTQLPYLGKKFCEWGAFPVSRGKVMNRAYLRSLCEQVSDMLDNGDNVVVFPEGGRSYKGNMMEMRNGLIGSCLVAQKRNPDKDFYFFPAAISYERLPELLQFDLLKKGKDLRGDSKNFLKRIKGNILYFGADILAFSRFMFSSKLNLRYGNVYIDYEEPVAVNDMIDINGLYNAGARDDFSALRKAIQLAGDHIHRRFFSLYRLLPIHILAKILVSNPNCTPHDAGRLSEDIAGDLREKGRNTLTLDTMNGVEMVEKATNQFTAFRAVSRTKNAFNIKNVNVVRYHAESCG